MNGRLAVEWENGCTSFRFDIAALVLPRSDNEILVRVNYQAPNARWYTGAGIYRDVSLLIKKRVPFWPDGIYISTSLQDGQWRYAAQADVITGGKAYEVRHTLVEQGEPIPAWDLEDPRRYTLRSELIVDGKVTDTLYTRFGFRTLRYTADEGVFLKRTARLPRWLWKKAERRRC